MIFKKLLIWLFLCAYISLNVSAKEHHPVKPIIDTSTFDKWPAVGGLELNKNGTYALYGIEHYKWDNDNARILCTTDGKWRDTLKKGTDFYFSNDGNWLLSSEPGDSLRMFDLRTRKANYITGVTSFQFSAGTTNSWLAYQGTEKGELDLMSLLAAKRQHFKNVGWYGFEKSGNVMLWQEGSAADSDKTYRLHLFDLNTTNDVIIWQGGEQVRNFSYDPKDQQVVFLTSDTGKNNSIWYYKKDNKSAGRLAENQTPGIDSNLLVTDEQPLFSNDGTHIFFNLAERPKPEIPRTGVMVDVWNYKDIQLQSKQLAESNPESIYLASIPVTGGRVVQIQVKGETMISRNELGHYGLIRLGGDDIEGWWQKAARASIELVDNYTGKHKLLKFRLPYDYGVGNFTIIDDRYIIYFDPAKDVWYSYEIPRGRIHNLTKGSNINWIWDGLKNPALYRAYPAGIAGFLQGNSQMLVYDNNDIWQLDLAGTRKALCITAGYGKKHNIQFKFWNYVPQSPSVIPLSMGDTVILQAFNKDSKEQGFYKIILGRPGDPKKLNMGQYGLSVQRKADAANVWIISRRTATQSPNWFTTTDFVHFQKISNIFPEKKYNWITSELVNWKLPDGTISQGILYKPENFDPAKKYPLLITYYEQLSDGLNQYQQPQVTCAAEVNVPYFVSRGYLIFEPDIHYHINYTGQSALLAVESAARYLSKRLYIDPKRIGICGHSFGGFETNYIVTHSHLFAAAAEGSGESDVISSYASVRQEGHNGGYFMYEQQQYRMSVTPWQRPDLYLANSPILSANNVTTPFLMMNNKGDNKVSYTQGLELFLALRRLQKKVWLLQYDDQGHVALGRSGLDYTHRIEQFFDHYLKGAPAPKWMVEGIPAKMKGIETGYELEPGREP